MESLLKEKLAFSTDSSLTSASSRTVLSTTDGTLLNIELFSDPETTNKNSPILLYTHGICASAETLSLQNIVSAAKQHNVKVAALELEGHGLSSGSRSVCGDFERLLSHVLQFVQHTVPILREDPNDASAPYFVAGNSIGGALSTYAAENISKNAETYPSNFKGLATICPSVGINPNKVPSAPIVFALSILATMAPSLQISLTPHQDPEDFNCPKDSKRNFEGHLPLATARMLLDVTSAKIKNDLGSEKLQLKFVENVLIFAGKTDETVPIESITDFQEKISPKSKEFVIVDGGHCIMTYQETAKVVNDALFAWINVNSTK